MLCTYNDITKLKLVTAIDDVTYTLRRNRMKFSVIVTDILQSDYLN